MEKQGPPYCVKIELTEGCNLRCKFCGLLSIRGKENDLKFSSLDTIELIGVQMAKLGWNSRIEFAMHGEPSLNPQLLRIIAILRSSLPHTYMLMTSNGGGLLRDTQFRVGKLFKCGLDTLALDDYSGVHIVEKIRERVKDMELEDVELFEYPSCGSSGNPHKRMKTKRLVFIRDIVEAGEGTHSFVHNSGCSSAPPNKTRINKRCAKPFRELAIRHDGSVAICCVDWRGWYKVGNIHELGLEGVWNHERFGAARRKLYRGQRDFGPCNGCDAPSYRVGLLPDGQGKKKLAPPTVQDAKIIAEALSGGVYTKPLFRDWEDETLRKKIGDKCI